MLLRTLLLLGLKPRNYAFTPPKLARRPGRFECKACRHRWSSTNVWVTARSHRCYQGETCRVCGTTNKPYWIGDSFARDMFNTERAAGEATKYHYDKRRQR